MVWNGKMIDKFREEDLRSLFAERLPDEPLPPAMLDRLTVRVLDEVHTIIEPQVAGSPMPNGATKGLFAGTIEGIRHFLRGLSPRQSLALAGAGALAASLLFIGVSRITPRPLSLTAEVSGGEVTILNWHADRIRVQGDGDVIKLRQGDRILAETGNVQINLAPDQVAVVGPGAHVELTRLDEANGGQQLALTVHDGAIESRLRAPLGEQDLYVINTAGVTVTAVGTDFTVQAVSADETLVTAMKGQVNVVMGDEAVTVGAGEEVDAFRGRSLVVQPADGKYDGGRKPFLLAVAADDGLQLYALPRADAAPVGRLPAGDSVTIQAEDAGGNWVQICCVAGRPAWVQIR
jgi:hypothetical protein